MLGRTGGFTLIEVLLVILLTSVLVALVAPLGVQQVDKARAQTEWLTLQREIGHLSMHAFLRGEFITVDVSGKQLEWRSGRGEQGVMQFEQLFFSPPQRITINPNGIADRSAIEVQQRERQRRMVIMPEVRE